MAACLSQAAHQFRVKLTSLVAGRSLDRANTLRRTLLRPLHPVVASTPPYWRHDTFTLGRFRQHSSPGTGGCQSLSLSGRPEPQTCAGGIPEGAGANAMARLGHGQVLALLDGGRLADWVTPLELDRDAWRTETRSRDVLVHRA